MGTLDGITLAIALLGAGLGVFNTVIGYRRGRRKLTIKPVRVERSTSFIEVQIEVVNPGYVPVTVREIALVAVAKGEARAVSLRDQNGNPILPRTVAGGNAVAVITTTRTLRDPLMLGLCRIRVETGDGCVVERTSRRLRQLAAELQSAAAEEQGSR